MSYQEKRSIVNMTIALLMTAAYGIYALGRYRTGSIGLEDTKAWALAMLVFIGSGVIAGIAIQIAFHFLIAVSIAARERGGGESAIGESIEATMTEDEMDRLVELRSSRAGKVCAASGFLAALVAAALGASAALLLNILFLSFAVGAVAESLFTLRLYRKGLSNG
ncbi:MAG: hypothetical protein Q8M76_08355 [Spirochaetaceae bacterium]|nr:hypothetical protein [Spirochaetaceae bacterium]